MQPKVSVILPFYNEEKYLAEAIESILEQTYEDFELILVNNNSSDTSMNIASEFASKDSRIRIIDEVNRGIAHALNAGLDEANGEYILRMDADDISHPDRMERQVDFLNSNPDIGLVACCVNHISTAEDQQGLEDYVNWNNSIISTEEIELNRFIESPVIHPSVCFRRNLVTKYGGYRHGGFPEDYELWLRWISHGVKMVKLPEHLLDWTDVPTRLTRTDDRYSTEAFYEIKTNYVYNWLKDNNEFFPDLAVWGAGKLSRQRFGLLRELGIEPKFFIDIYPNPTHNVIQYKDTPMPGTTFIVSYVSSRGAREKIKQFLVELGYIEGENFICVS